MSYTFIFFQSNVFSYTVKKHGLLFLAVPPNLNLSQREREEIKHLEPELKRKCNPRNEDVNVVGSFSGLLYFLFFSRACARPSERQRTMTNNTERGLGKKGDSSCKRRERNREGEEILMRERERGERNGE